MGIHGRGGASSGGEGRSRLGPTRRACSRQPRSLNGMDKQRQLIELFDSPNYRPIILLASGPSTGTTTREWRDSIQIKQVTMLANDRWWPPPPGEQWHGQCFVRPNTCWARANCRIDKQTNLVHQLEQAASWRVSVEHVWTSAYPKVKCTDREQ